MTQRDVRDYLSDILNAIELAESFIVGISFDEFEDDPKTNFAVIRALEMIGEAVKNIPESVCKQYPNVPWRGFAGMRDKLIHAYFGVKLEVVWDTVHQDLPVLRPVIERILREIGSS